MGLFTSNKKLCPICNSPTPKIFADKAEGMVLCRNCAGKVDLPEGMLRQMSVDSLRQYMDFYDENQELRSIFSANCRVDLGFIAGSILVDTVNGLFRLGSDEKRLVMEAASLRSFRIMEDGQLLFESAGNMLKCYKSDIPSTATSLGPIISQYVTQRRMMEQMEREMDERRRKGEDVSYTYYGQASLPCPFQYFYVEMELEHPYWGAYCGKMEAPAFDRNYPDIGTYLREYNEKAYQLHRLATSLMQLISPGAREVREGDSAFSAQASVPDVAKELQKYKALADYGVLTPEEFAAKKRQLLGIRNCQILNCGTCVCALRGSIETE